MAAPTAQESAGLRSPALIPARPAVDTPVIGGTVGRLPLFDPAPRVPHGHPAKAFVGEVVPFDVVAFREGHDRIGVHLRLTDPAGNETLHRLTALADGTDRWRTRIALDRQGDWQYRFESFADDFATWAHDAAVKAEAGIDVTVMSQLGNALLTAAASETDRPDAERRMLKKAARALSTADADALHATAIDQRLASAFAARPHASLGSHTEWLTLRVDRELAGVSAWYEFFPRSEGAVRRKDGSVRSGTLRTAAKRLPAVADMGFDVIYLVPIHPIGTTNRKGRNNTLTTEPGDPGSPYAIGSADGGHDAIHPDLGTEKDFRAFVRAARTAGLEVALDLALQASPDHPWVTEHPEWFTTLPDGTIAYAENPPKKYQDIYPLNFDNDPAGIYAEMLRVVMHWVDLGVKIFRVDNPHTKPLQFWEWLIAEVGRRDPDVIFLAEAFTRPAVMRALAAIGFQQSYSYFTWRNTKTELEEFLTSVSHETSDYMRPNLFVNTHDILTEYLQFGGRAAYRIRACIAATAGPVWGVYAGYELIENVARPGSEENIDNEKYEYKFRDWDGAEQRGESLAPLLRRLNAIRHAHPALGQLRNLSMHWSDDDAVLVYSKHLDAAFTGTGTADTLIIVANVDPHSVRETTVHLDTRIWGIEPGDDYEVEDLLTGAVWTWNDHNYVRLDAFAEPVHILKVKERS
ncbi:alpha-1,4-glucan--maltose-1-phosphate maltosyltransferase [Microbacterium esteraromaticum]|uniref:alpha-1,4-glucan--maltose-1-phosphate maltosyltransferase n=1 Tax=Microbacterium esteraromaticum TaxID=57043 RepID=UPI001CD3AE7D|nr:alpha-1,4-glucan--maltose-1-phosphate maltosyltransferase [Microbacterium esteraromaticum]MCA1306201.1 alpha-1,4-glucan--maltose-1-phosphate maltosyltransferase [Microbacterium esteraromaticum]